jgi:hypothetical protein
MAAPELIGAGRRRKAAATLADLKFGHGTGHYPRTRVEARHHGMSTWCGWTGRA